MRGASDEVTLGEQVVVEPLPVAAPLVTCIRIFELGVCGWEGWALLTEQGGGQRWRVLVATNTKKVQARIRKTWTEPG